MSDTRIGSVVPIWAAAGGGTPPPAPFVGSIPYIVWRPGNPSAAPYFVQTWAEVEAAIAATEGNIIVAVDGIGTIPGGVSTQCFGRVTFRSYTSNLGSSTGIIITDGSYLRNPWTVIGSMSISGTPTIRPMIDIDIPGSQVICREGGNIILSPGATQPGIDFLATFCQAVTFEGGVLQNQSGTLGLGLIRVAPGNTALEARIAAAGTSPPPGEYSADTWMGGAGGLLLQIYDSSSTQVAQPNFTGTVFGLPMSFSLGTVYQDGLVTPTTGETTAQGMLDRLKRLNLGAGTTAGRPAVADVAQGAMYFDTDLGFPVWVFGLIYVDAAGAPT